MPLRHKFLISGLLLAIFAGIALAKDEPVSHPGPLSAAEFELSDFEGQIVLVDFWASWCKPCAQALPWLNAMQVTVPGPGPPGGDGQPGQGPEGRGENGDRN